MLPGSKTTIHKTFHNEVAIVHVKEICQNGLGYTFLHFRQGITQQST